MAEEPREASASRDVGWPLTHDFQVCNCQAIAIDLAAMKIANMLLPILAACGILQLAVAQDSDPLDTVLTNNGAYFTTNFGQPVFSENASLTVGSRGAPISLGLLSSLTDDHAHGLIYETSHPFPEADL